MNHSRLQLLKLWLGRFWLLSPERLWLASIRLQTRGHWVLAFWIKQLNTLLYHNSLAPGATVSPDVRLGHNSIGIVVNSQVVIGRRVKIWHNATLSADRPLRPVRGSDAARAVQDSGAPRAGAGAPGPRSRIILEDDVKIGASAVVIPPRGCTLRIGRGARIGAGTVVTEDVPAGATVVGPAARVLPRKPAADEAGDERPEVEPSQ
jgi:serine O-acetyltransferase